MDAQGPPTTKNPVVVGVDGCVGGMAALRVGAWEAASRRRPLLIVHARTAPTRAVTGRAVQALRAAVRRAGAETVRDAEARARASRPRLHTRTAVVTGSAAGVLVELSAAASLVVVSARGCGEMPATTLGPVATQVAQYAHAPVIVVRPTNMPDTVGPPPDGASGPVVVGIDGSGDSDHALAFALAEASARGAGLTAVYAWSLPDSNLSRPGPVGADWRDDEADRILAGIVGRHGDGHPDVTVRAIVCHSSNPAFTLIDASRGAGLLVVGARGQGGFPDQLLGSVSQAVIAHAACPVAVVRDRHGSPPPGHMRAAGLAVA
jgi:nucleotide-binding universal stress UspA family protein